jgi:hypothetical protein
MKKGERMLTIKEAAAKVGAAEISVRIWAKAGRFPGARLETTPMGSYWVIPESALEGFENPGRGRPPKPDAKRPRSRKAREAKNN